MENNVAYILEQILGVGEQNNGTSPIYIYIYICICIYIYIHMAMRRLLLQAIFMLRLTKKPTGFKNMEGT